jgi:hypothetical protein
MSFDKTIDERADLLVTASNELEFVKSDQDRTVDDELFECGKYGSPTAKRFHLMDSFPRDSRDLSADVLEVISF